MLQITPKTINDIPCYEIQNKLISMTICPAAGGKIVSLKLRETNQELLWHNPNLTFTVHPQGTSYDATFFGGIDELFPNDEKETIDGREYLDHGELWTSPLNAEVAGDDLTLTAKLPLAEMTYEKKIKLSRDEGRIDIDYVIKNLRTTPSYFLWKMHAAMNVHAGDKIICPAKNGTLLDEDFANRHGQPHFSWPHWKTDRMDLAPDINSQKREFFYLSDLDQGQMRIESQTANTFFEYQFDKQIFPYAWVFATYGGWNGLYTIVLEPCTAVPHVLSKSIADRTCSCLPPGDEIRTRVTINVGSLNQPR
jgi:galactose mutarotase-like enzyme